MIVRAYVLTVPPTEVTCGNCNRLYPHDAPSLTGTCSHCRHEQNLAEEASFEAERRMLVRYGRSIPDCQNLLLYRETCDSRTPNEERPQWQHLWADVRSGDQVVILDLARVWARHTPCLRAFLALLDARVSIRMLSPPALVCPGTPCHYFLQYLGQIEARATDELAAARKSRARAQGKPTNQYSAGYGWKWARAKDGTVHRVPDDKVRRVMRTVLHRRADGHTWRGIADELRRQGIKSPHNRPYSIRSLIRLHDAAQRLLQPDFAAS